MEVGYHEEGAGGALPAGRGGISAAPRLGRLNWVTDWPKGTRKRNGDISHHSFLDRNNDAVISYIHQQRDNWSVETGGEEGF